jgi:hypothetical protein
MISHHYYPINALSLRERVGVREVSQPSPGGRRGAHIKHFMSERANKCKKITFHTRLHEY